jgi:hypothetical protein
MRPLAFVHEVMDLFRKIGPFLEIRLLPEEGFDPVQQALIRIIFQEYISLLFRVEFFPYSLVLERESDTSAFSVPTISDNSIFSTKDSI